MAKDPYKYFRIEARELLDGLHEGALALEKGAAPKEPTARLLRLAHTLKGAARVVKQPAIAEAAHAIEAVLAPFRESDAPVPRDRTGELLRLVDAIAAALGALGGSPAAPVASAVAGDLEPVGASDVRGLEVLHRTPALPPPVAGGAPALQRPVSEPFETVRVDIGEVDTLLDGITEAAVQVGGLRDRAREVDAAARAAAELVEALRRGTDARSQAEARGAAEKLGIELGRVRRELAAGLDRTEAELRAARDGAHTLRLLQAGAIFRPLERAARDAAEALGKRIEFEASGGQVRLDGHVLGAIRDALSHAVRNSVDHGIEPEAERRAAGKPAAGRVSLQVERRGDRVAFVCRDDGRGIDVAAVARAAVRGGRLAPAEAERLDLDGAVRLLLQGGVSTSRAVTGVSGRAVGLDVVRDTAATLKGELAVRSERGRGTTIEILVPVSLSSLTILLVEAGGRTASLPLEAVRRTVRVPMEEMVRTADAEAIVFEGAAIPFAPLARILGAPAPGGGAARQAWSVVVLGGPDGLAAVGVDRLLGTSDVVMRPLPSLAGALPLGAGASFDAEGNPQLVLDPRGVAAAVRAARARAAEDPGPAARPPVLVIDDSLTTRMLESSILELAGYDVDVATSAEEALEKARRRPYGIFICDVEMPGMDGFEFVARTRADAALREVPAILVSSLSSESDRRRGIEVGARSYIVKGEFDQDRFLGTVRDLIR